MGDVDLNLPIDWHAPWLVPYRAIGSRVQARWAACGSLAEALNAERTRSPMADWPQGAAGPLRFVPQAQLPAGQGYEAFIFAHAEVPTRDNLHDFFNGLVWLTRPVLKRWLNQQQAAQLAMAEAGTETSAPGRRGPVRDALTLFDENAAVWQAPAVLFEALRRRDWPAVFHSRRAVWADTTLTVVGHALLEKLCRPRKGITAHVWWVAPDAGAVDAALCGQLTPTCLVQRPWAPLPVLGVPGWWPANEEAAFYDDPGVFRPLG